MEYESEVLEDIYQGLIDEARDLESKNTELKRELAKYKAKESRSQKTFNYILCTRKNDTKFIKVVYDSYEADGWIEIARINLSKNEWVQNNFSMEDVFGELK